MDGGQAWLSPVPLPNMLTLTKFFFSALPFTLLIEDSECLGLIWGIGCDSQEQTHLLLLFPLNHLKAEPFHCLSARVAGLVVR